MQDIAPEEDPTGDRRLQDMLRISNPDPSKWSPAVTIPLYPIVFTADTTVKFAQATAAWVAGTVQFVAGLFGGSPSTPAPEAVDRAAEGLRQK